MSLFFATNFGIVRTFIKLCFDQKSNKMLPFHESISLSLEDLRNGNDGILFYSIELSLIVEVSKKSTWVGWLILMIIMMISLFKH